ncbi:Dabb family protein [Roseisalinus antarcticus]|uniref:Stress responsive A/B Barrel Domain protein n=1 Tax=Roseisalinus antarcticus TaxID=254357 RepID=A0A1Y5SPE4_9RHOB|nr:Dabb family protein [Roseisalinus antarcticus]SLN44970.1 Stress responsive A/B Barrel Domain protein [Roseisalinus antarcticus]
MIVHVVLLRLARGWDAAELADVMDGLGVLSLPGLLGFRHGPNLDAERKSPQFPYGFVVDFADRAALDRYAADPGHQALGARLVALCEGGGDGIFVADLDAG